MTPDELRALVDEGMELTPAELKALGAYRVENSTDENDVRAEAFDRANEALERMALDLARLCTELGEAAQRIVDCRYHTDGEAEYMLAKISELEAL